MGYRDNVHDSPASYGLMLVAELDAGGGYDFDYFAVWLHADGRMFWGRDAGCSCPSPWEDFTSLDSLTPATFDECIAAMRKWYDGMYSDKPPLEDVVAFEKAVRDAGGASR